MGISSKLFRSQIKYLSGNPPLFGLRLFNLFILLEAGKGEKLVTCFFNFYSVKPEDNNLFLLQSLDTTATLTR